MPRASEPRLYDQRARDHFALLPMEQQADSIRRLSALGYGDHELARITGLHVEQVRRVLGERREVRA